MSKYFRERLDFEKANIFTGYQYKVSNTLKNENIKLANLINTYYLKSDDKVKSTFNIYHIFLLSIFFIFVFTYFILNSVVIGQY